MMLKMHVADKGVAGKIGRALFARGERKSGSYLREALPRPASPEPEQQTQLREQ
jgi:hypothetical protein